MQMAIFEKSQKAKIEKEDASEKKPVNRLGTLAYDVLVNEPELDKLLTPKKRMKFIKTFYKDSDTSEMFYRGDHFLKRTNDYRPCREWYVLINKCLIVNPLVNHY
jgi:hypothetical protein